MKLLAQHSPAFEPSRPWQQLASRQAGESRLFRQMALLRRSPHGNVEHEFTRLDCPEWVNVIAFREAALGGELLVVEQFRHGIDRATLEIVGGVCEPGEDPAHAASRELREETGHREGRLVPLGSCAPNPAVQSNRCHFFLALDCRPEGPLQLDASEELRLWAVPWPEWEARLRSGEIDHALVLAAFLRLRLWEGWDKLEETLSRP